MKRIFIILGSLIGLSLVWVTFIGLAEGIERTSSGNYFTPVDKTELPHILGREFTVNVSDDILLFGKIRKAPFSDRAAITLKLRGTRNYSLYFGGDPLPSKKDIAIAVEGELFRLGLKSGIELAIVTLPLDASQQIEDSMRPIKMEEL